MACCSEETRAYSAARTQPLLLMVLHCNMLTLLPRRGRLLNVKWTSCRIAGGNVHAAQRLTNLGKDLLVSLGQQLPLEAAAFANAHD